MATFLLKRILMTVPTLALVSVIVFLLMRLIPGDPALIMLGDTENPDALDLMRQRMGLDRSYLAQFLLWFTSILRGELGASLITGELVLPTILYRFSVTAQITVIAVLLGALIAVPAGMLAALKQNRPADSIVVFTSALLLSLPSFWIGLLLILLFGVYLGWLPFIGWVSVFDGGIATAVYLVMPITALVLGEVAAIARMARASTIEVLRLEYITHARAKGLSERTVLWGHAFPNTFAPVMTLIGLILGSLLGGAAVIETVFTLPGLGRLLVEGIYARDYPIVQGSMLFIALIFIIVNLLVDLLYPVFDPRVRL